MLQCSSGRDKCSRCCCPATAHIQTQQLHFKVLVVFSVHNNLCHLFIHACGGGDWFVSFAWWMPLGECFAGASGNLAACWLLVGSLLLMEQPLALVNSHNMAVEFKFLSTSECRPQPATPASWQTSQSKSQVTCSQTEHGGVMRPRFD